MDFKVGPAVTQAEETVLYGREAAEAAAVIVQNAAETLQYARETPGGRLFVPPAYYQVTGDAAVTLDAAADWVAVKVCPTTDYLLSSLSSYFTAVTVQGRAAFDIYKDAGAGPLPPVSTDVTPVMTAANAPSPAVVTTTNEHAGYPAWQVFDGDPATFWNTTTPTTWTFEAIMLNMGTGNGIAPNKWRWKSYAVNSTYNPKKFKLQGTISALAVVTDAVDSALWVDLETAYAAIDYPKIANAIWTEWFTFNNTTSYEKLRVVVLDYYDATDKLIIISEIEMAVDTSLLSSLGTLDSGASADVWKRHVVSTPYQLERGKAYWLVQRGQPVTSFGASVRRVNTVVGSMFPDSMSECVSSTDGGATWAAVTQDSVAALLNVILNSTANSASVLGYGRYASDYMYIPGTGIVTIPAGGVFLDCEALTVDTLYYVYAYMVGSVLTLEASTTVRTKSNGIDVKSGTTTHRFLGMIYPKAIQTAKQGPVDVPDRRLVVNAFNSRLVLLGKRCPYSANTLTYPATTWTKWAAADDFRIEMLSSGLNMISLSGSTGVYAPPSDSATATFGVDSDTVHSLFSSIGGLSNNVQQGTVFFNVNISLSEGFHYIVPLGRSDAAGRVDLFYTVGYCDYRALLTGHITT